MIHEWDLPGGARVRVRASGEPDAARRILLATDPPNMLETYGPLFARLKPHARVAAYEAPGFGFSRAPRGHRHTLDAQAAAAIELLERLGASAAAPWVLAFPCVGAYVALRVARKRPDLVAGLVLTQAPSWSQEAAWVERVDRRGLLRTPGVGQALTLLRADPLVHAWYRASVADEKQAVRFAKLALESMDHGARFPLAAAFQTLFPRGSAAAPELGVVDVPTLLVWGSADRTHRESDPASMREHVPQAELVVLDGVGHLPELEAPRAFAEALLRWLERADLSAQARSPSSPPPERTP